ncbi:MAG TPA: NAD(P)-dependent oxidoreductase [Candidatus Dormibacteraeota bacterium]|nr:NAD(P)-dependent oxidoreductase [Candidatus Dormibacteraeota bacterium]
MTDGADQLPRLGWIGTGRMGAEMVTRLLSAGSGVVVYNRTRAKAEPLAKLGATIADHVTELGGCEVVFVAVSSSGDLQQVLLGPEGLLSGEARPRIVVDFSTVSAEASAAVRQELAKQGVELLAAPVSGNPKVARAGRLTMAVSGPAAAFESVADLLAQLGSAATYVGEGELARLVKICHNLFLGVLTQSLVEVTVLAEKGGVSREAFLRYLNGSVLGSTFTRYKTPQLVNTDYGATFTTNLLRKDFDLGLAAAHDLGVPLPVASLVQQLVMSLISLGYGEEDFAALLELQGRNSGLKVVSEQAEVPDGLGTPG